ncbi:MAG: MYXO-CTERM sorting domain-containing protein [Myxococcota bacterium]
MVRWFLILGGFLVTLLQSSLASAQLNERASFNQKGRILFLANSVVTCDRSDESAEACDRIESTTGLPVEDNDDISTVYIDVDGDASTYNSSEVFLTLDADQVVTWAGLYWVGVERTTSADPAVTGLFPITDVLFQVPGGSYERLASDSTLSGVGGPDTFRSFKDVTAEVQAAGAGTYTAANVGTRTGANDHLGGWMLVVIIADPDEPLRNLVVYDGLSSYGLGTTLSVDLEGFITPNVSGFSASATFGSLDGDADRIDRLRFLAGEARMLTGTGALLSNSLNPDDNYGNSTLSRFTTGGNGGLAEHFSDRNPAYRNTLGFDVDTYDVSDLFSPSDTGARLVFDDDGEEGNFAFLAALEVELFVPVLDVIKTVSIADGDTVGPDRDRDNAGTSVVPGVELEFRIDVSHNATDSKDNAVSVELTDLIPEGTVYVAGSMIYDPDGAASSLTDAVDGDQGEYDAVADELTIRLGTGANASDGGSLDLASDERASVTFRVEVLPGATGLPIANIARVSFQGQTLAGAGGDVISTFSSPAVDSTGPTVLVVADLDRDNDGIANDAENAFGVDPDADSDGDGIVDALDAIDGTGTSGMPYTFQNCPDITPADGECDRYGTVFDTDLDGIPNHLDLDSDQDGLFDVIEAGFAGLDADRDGTIDGLEDADADGIPDPYDPDAVSCTDGNTNGICDTAEGMPDSDSDGVADSLDIDEDGDGQADATETATPPDSDRDGDADAYDTDADGDGISDLAESGLAATADINDDDVFDVLADTNANGIFDYLELPAGCDDLAPTDNICDVYQVGTDQDGDGINDDNDIDADGDGALDLLDGVIPQDTDRDGVRDALDRDSDGDTLDDALEGLVDTDGDTVPDILDLDSDNDGIADIDEAGGVPAGADENDDGRTDVDESVGANGRLDAVDGADDWVSARDPAPADTDGDGIFDFRDVDSDNDLLTDTFESGGVDADDNGRLDGFTDGNGDGLDDDGPLRGPDGDRDGDGIPDRVDVDSDNDTIADLVENGFGDLDGDADGLPDVLVDADGDGLYDTLTPQPADFDGDGTPNAFDLDSDNDGTSDLEESGADAAVDTNNDGVADTIDSDRDGLVDLADSEVGTFGGFANSPRNSENDSGETDDEPDYLNSDSDEDGLPDALERGNRCGSGSSDANCDGLIDDDADADGDGIADAIDTIDGFGGLPFADADGDGTPDASDPDDDDDGIPDDDEGAGDSDGDGIVDRLDLDSDNDGIPDASEGNADVDGDGLSNRIDVDSDGDGLSDLDEAGLDALLDGDDDGRIDDTAIPGSDGNADGWVDVAATALGVSPTVLPDSDADTVPDFLDLDSDNDGIPDSVESGGADADGDGLVDTNGLNRTPADTDGDSVANHLDSDSDNDGLSDLFESGRFNVPTVDADNDGVIDDASDNDGDGLLSRVDLDDAVWGSPGALLPVNTPNEAGLSNDAPDYRTEDRNEDGVPDAVLVGRVCGSAAFDANCDGVLDSGDQDGDGIDDLVDDSDRDGVVDADDSTPGDARGALPLPDTDGDGIADVFDIDDDDDGIRDEDEAPLGVPSPVGDVDGDGIPNYLDADAPVLAKVCTDSVAPAGVCDAPAPSYDADSDGIPNHLDLDSDGDGIPDLVEGGNVGADDNNDALVDEPNGDNGLDDTLEDPADSGATTRVPTDSDGDGVPDFLDLDSDGDGISDIDEAGYEATDGNDDGRVDDLTDSDRDGIADAVDDSDSDGIFDDTDSDTGPGSDTAPLLGRDLDGDSIPDVFDGDSPTDGTSGDTDGDGTSDADECLNGWPCPDSDGDGIPDYADPDSDNDGTPDESDPDPSDPCVPDNTVAACDTDGDGVPDGNDPDPADPCVPDVNAPACDSDGDGTPDGSDPDPNDPCVPSTNAPTCDADGDGTPDGSDPDPDDPCVPDNTVAACDTDGDGTPDGSDTDPDDPCNPDPNSEACLGGGSGSGDRDGDGSGDGGNDDDATAFLAGGNDCAQTGALPWAMLAVGLLLRRRRNAL